ncbi:MAG: Uracil phosphoribosyltransferase [Chlamydiae bacterium]|nr:Uracil phosphoribosyltransferase [Chlamydiota bacterium]
MYKFLISCLFLMAGFAQNPYLEKQLFVIRNPQTNRVEFRKAMKKIGESLAVRISKNLSTKTASIKTVLEKSADHQLLDEDLVLVTILRAGLPMLNGMMKVFPDAEIGFLAMKRNEKTLLPTVFYQGMPSLKGKTVIIADPMIATGGSMLDAVKIVESLGAKRIIVAGAMSTDHGIGKIKQYKSEIPIYSGVIDPLLNEIGYIVPGLGDAGDRSFGLKID